MTGLAMMLFGVLMFSNLFLLTKMDRLNEFIVHYEPIVYEVISLAQVPPEDGNSPPAHHHQLLTFSFYAFERYFDLQLVSGSKVLSARAQISVHTANKGVKSVSADTVLRNLVDGRLADEPDSSVHGVVNGGIFDGIITSQGEQYFVEPANLYFHGQKLKFKSVIFRRSDINQTATKCASDEECRPFLLDQVDGPEEDEDNELPKGPRKKVLPSNSSSEGVCTMKIIADHTFFQIAGNRSVHKTIHEMTVLLNEADDIFRAAHFNKPLELLVMGVDIWTDVNETAYSPLAYEWMSANDFLAELARYDMSEYCLGIAFVHRRFPKKVLGLAYTGSPKRHIAGGICQKRSRTGMPKSYNVVVVSVQGAMSRMPRATSIITLSHELGHSFGSGHDPVDIPACTPSLEEGGAFLMSPYAVSGESPNHRRFSPCSVHSIDQLVHTKGLCLQYRAHLHNLCGNAIHNPEREECDCGDAAQCHEIDPCCTPVGGLGKDEECTLRHNLGAVCTPLSAPCCSNQCLPTQDRNLVCRESSECLKASTCNGISYNCPPNAPKPDGTPCRGGDGKCRGGVCVDTWCRHPYLDECTCMEHHTSCLLCCRIRSLCISASNFGMANNSQGKLFRQDGEFCNGEKGMCRNGTCELFFIPVVVSSTKSLINLSINLPIDSSINSPIEVNDDHVLDGDDRATFDVQYSSWKALLIFNIVLLTVLALIMVVWSCIPMSSWFHSGGVLRDPPSTPVIRLLTSGGSSKSFDNTVHEVEVEQKQIALHTTSEPADLQRMATARKGTPTLTPLH